MEFNEIIKTVVQPVLQQDGLNLVHEYKNYLRYESAKVIVTFTRNELEFSNALFVTKKHGDGGNVEIDIDDDVIQNFFLLEVKLNYISITDFAHRIVDFLANKGKALLQGSEIIFVPLLAFKLNRDQTYHDQIMNDQLYNRVDRAWDEKNYAEVIQTIKEIGLDKIKASYHLKYNYALKHNK